MYSIQLSIWKDAIWGYQDTSYETSGLFSEFLFVNFDIVLPRNIHLINYMIFCLTKEALFVPHPTSFLI